MVLESNSGVQLPELTRNGRKMHVKTSPPKQEDVSEALRTLLVQASIARTIQPAAKRSHRLEPCLLAETSVEEARFINRFK